MTLEKTIYMNFMNIRLYTNVLNLLNTKNITRVYPQTGTDDDDGWLKHPLAKSYLAIPGYEAVYRTFNLVNGYNGANGATWTGPRQLRFGVSFEFN
jgi:hypothetical protein